MNADPKECADPGSPTQREPGGGVARAAIVVSEGARTSVYPMFDATDIAPEGAFLAGSLFLEVGETAVVELSWEDGEQVRVNARVTSLDRGVNPGMKVAFSDLDERACDVIAARSEPASQQTGGSHGRDHR